MKCEYWFSIKILGKSSVTVQNFIAAIISQNWDWYFIAIKNLPELVLEFHWFKKKTVLSNPGILKANVCIKSNSVNTLLVVIWSHNR